MRKQTLLLLISLASFVASFNDFNELVIELQKGTTYIKLIINKGSIVKGLIQLGNCTPQFGDLIIQLDLSTYQYFNDPLFGGESIKFSSNNIIGGENKCTFAWEYIQGSIYANSTIALQLSASSATKELLYKQDLKCDMNNASQVQLKSFQKFNHNLQFFNDIQSSLLASNDLRVILNIEKCYSYIGPFGKVAPKTILGWNSKAFKIKADEIELSVFGMIRNFMKPTAFLYNYDKASIFTNGTFYLEVHGIDTDNFQEYFSEYIYCTINNGENDGAIDIFSDGEVLRFIDQ